MVHILQTIGERGAMEGSNGNLAREPLGEERRQEGVWEGASEGQEQGNTDEVVLWPTLPLW